MKDSIEPLRPTFSLEEDRINALRQILPEAFADGKINFDTLRQLLGDDVEDEREEHFGLSWTGKREARRLAGLPSKGTLVPVPGEGFDEATTENIFIEGDNLEVLKLLHKSYRGRVKMIYIDPPYNTGNDFIYKDDYREPLESYLQRSGQMTEAGELLSSNPKSTGRFHSNWMNMIYPRLRVAKDLLRDDGVIFVSIDDNELQNLRQMMNEIFGEENLVSILSVITNAKGRNDKKNVAPCHEYLIIFAKENFNSYGLPLTEEQLKEYKYKDIEGYKYALRDLRKRGRPDRREDRPNMWYPIYFNPETKTFALERQSEKDIEITPQKGDGADGRWRWGKDRVKKNLEILEARYSSKKDRWDIDHRVYLDLNRFPDVDDDDEEADDDDETYQRTSKSKSFWTGGEISTDVGRREFKNLFPDVEFDYPKSPYLLKRILNMSVANDEICLDFYSGSGTTAQAILELNNEDKGNRKFICVQLPEQTPVDSDARKAGFNKISEITKERIRRAIKRIKIKQNGSSPLLQQAENSDNGERQDLGFKVFRLERSNFRAWTDFTGQVLTDFRPLLEAAETPFVAEAQPSGILTEILLLEGFPLNSKVEPDNRFERNEVFRVASEFSEHRLFITLDEEVWEETIDRAAELDKNDIFICLDNSLGDENKVRLSDVCRLKTI